MQETTKILVVDDDLRLRSLLERYLVEQGFIIRCAPNAEQMDRLLARENFHLIVLDLMLPGEDGLSICQRLSKQEHSIPILMLTAKGDEVDRIIGLELGADDYLPKPFNPRELLARIKAILRRQSREAPGAPSQDDKEITFAEYSLNLSTREMRKGDTIMPLTSGEFALLGVDHPETARSLANVGQIFLDNNDYLKARRCFMEGMLVQAGCFVLVI